MAGPRTTPQKSHARPGANIGFWQAEVMKVTTSASDPHKVFIKSDRMGIGVNDPVPASYIGSPPRVGDVLWATFVENRHDDYLIFNTQHQVSDDITDGVVRFGGQIEQHGVTLKIDPTEYSGSNRASMQMHKTIMGTDASADGTEGDWYVYDNADNAWRIVVDTSGNVGIGTNSPDGLFHISAGESGDAEVIIEADTDNAGSEDDNPRLVFRQDGGLDMSAILQGNNFLTIANSDTVGGIIFSTGTSTGYANATERMRIEPGGYVGIGINNPTEKLHVVGNALITGNLTVNGSTTEINSTTLTVDDKNIELASTASPSDAAADGGGITLKGTTDKTILWTNSTDAWHFNQGINVTAGNVGIGTGSPDRLLTTSGAGTVLHHIHATDSAQSYTQYTNSTTGTTLYTDGMLVGVDTDETGVVYHSTALRFGTAGSERIRILADGKVGIGTETPAYKLHVAGAMAITAANGTGGYSHFPYTDGRFYYTADPETGGTGDHVFRHYSGGSYVERMRILETGNVGIGTSTPQQKLDVRGVVRIGLTDSDGGKIYGDAVSSTNRMVYYAEKHLFTNLAGTKVWIDTTINAGTHLYWNNILKLSTTSAGATVVGTVTATTFSGALSGNASTASRWVTSRTLTLTGAVTGSVTFHGGGAISNLVTSVNHSHNYAPYTHYHAGSALTGSSLASGITSSSLTSVGTLGSLTVSGQLNCSHFKSDDDSYLYFGMASSWQVKLSDGYFRPYLDADVALGSANLKWAGLYSSTWVRVSGSAGLFFQDHGGGFFMQDSTWIRTYNNKNFYHNTGIMRTDGELHVADLGARFIVNGSGNVGINDSSPSYRLDVNGTGRFTGALTVGSIDSFAVNAQGGNEGGEIALAAGGSGSSWQMDAFNGSWRVHSAGNVPLSINTDFAVTSTQVASDKITVQHIATNTSYASTLLLQSCYRTNNSAWYFMQGSSNSIWDREYYIRGDGYMAIDSGLTQNGADYAEYFEWEDGNPSEEDRRGITVTLVDNKIRAAVEGEDIIGVVSGNPAVVGDTAWNKWTDKYLRDDYGAYIRDAEGERSLNPDWDDSVTYVPREDRPEWVAIGLVGKLRIRKGQSIGASWIKMRDISDTVEEWLVR